MLGFIVGDLFAFAVLFNITQNMDPRIGFTIVAVFVAFLGLIILKIVKEPDLKKLHNKRNKKL